MNARLTLLAVISAGVAQGPGPAVDSVLVVAVLGQLVEEPVVLAHEAVFPIGLALVVVAAIGRVRVEAVGLAHAGERVVLS